MKHGSHNSLEGQIYMSLLESLVEHDCVDLWSSEKNRQRDWLEITNRYAREGLPFLTKVLPSFCKAFERALSTGTPYTPPVGFKTDKGGRFPYLFGDLLRSVFDDSGELLPSASERSVAGLRQMSLMFYKLELPYHHEGSQRVLNGFVETDASLPKIGDRDFSVDPIYRRARGLISSVLGGLDPTDIIPRHGTGSVATKEDVRGKSKFSRLYASCEPEYPFAEYFRFSVAHTCATIDEIQGLELLPEPTARVALVPKDSRGPRIISMEPLELMWLQQGLMSPVVCTIENHRLTKGHVNFRDQTVNRLLALKGSLSDDTVTIDMKDASDRVSLPLVSYLTEGTRLHAALMSLRSTTTVLPDGRVVRMNKYAPMGSALCFPIESIVFWAICVSVLWTAYGYSKRKACDSVYVYGDDLIVPKQHWVAIADKLHDADLRINPDKCCVAKGFRESCGMDAFRGQEVTPVRIKTRFTGALHEVLPGYVEMSNLAYRRGRFALADRLEELCRELLVKARLSPGLLPIMEKPCGVLAIIRPYASPKLDRHYGVDFKWHPGCTRAKTNRPTHSCWMVRGLQVQTKQLDPTYEGYDELLRSWHQYAKAGNFLNEEVIAMVKADAMRNTMSTEIGKALQELWMTEVDLGSYSEDKEVFTRDQRRSYADITLLEKAIASAKVRPIQEWDPLDPSSERGNTYVDKRRIKLARVWVALPN